MSGHYREGGLSSGVAFKRGSTVHYKYNTLYSDTPQYTVVGNAKGL